MPFSFKNLARQVTREVEKVRREVDNVPRQVKRVLEHIESEVKPVVKRARREVEGAVQGVARDVQPVVREVKRVVDTVGASLTALERIVADPEQFRRLTELVKTCDLKTFLRTLEGKRALPDDFFPTWIRRAGGYFPKFAQVLSVRADLIHNREVLKQLGRCLEDMPAKGRSEICDLLARHGWPADIRGMVGEDALNAGSVAQVNPLRLADGRVSGVVKVAWPKTKVQMQTDFRLFKHARGILDALSLDDLTAKSVQGMFVAVGKSEASVLREFDMRLEAQALRTAARLLRPGGEWDAAHARWAAGAMATALARAPAHLAELGRALATEARLQVRVPEPLGGLCCESALAMSHAGGESLHKLLSGERSEEGRRQATMVVLGGVIPFLGWLLLRKSTSDLAHVDPHPGNFRWDAASRRLWVLDWGSSVQLSHERRLALCRLIELVAHGDAEDRAVADAARNFGVRADSDCRLSTIVHGMLNAERSHSAQEELGNAAEKNLISDLEDTIVPVIRCLATLGGLLKKIQEKVWEEFRQDAPLSLAALWAPFASGD